MTTYYPGGTIKQDNLFEFKKNKLYTLLYRGQVIVNAAAYPVCNGKKSALLLSGNYIKSLFTIKPFTT